MQTIFLKSDEVNCRPELRHWWSRTVQEQGSNLALFRSPEWWDHLIATKGSEELRLAVTQSRDGRIIGTTPVQPGGCGLDFVVGTRNFRKVRLEALNIPGSEPNLVGDDHAHAHFFSSLFTAFPDCECVYLDQVLVGSGCWHFLRNVRASRSGFFPYYQRKFRPWRRLRIPASYERFLAGFSSKNRYKLKNRVSRLRRESGGKMTVRRFDQPSQVPEFVKLSLQVWEHSWKEQIVGGITETRHRWENSLVDLAERKILRAYILDCCGQPCAFVVGYQYGSIYHYVEPGYDARFSSFAPGIVLLMLLMEDLIRFNRPDVLDFGADDLEFKRLFSNENVEDAQVVLFRNTAANRLRWIAHSVFRHGIRLARRLTGRKTAE